MFSFYKNKIFLLSSISILLLAVGCKRTPVTIPESPVFSNVQYASPLTKKITDNVNLVKKVITDSIVDLTAGVKMTKIFYVDYFDNPMALFILEVDLNNPRITIKAGTPNNSNTFSTQLVADIARTQDRLGNRVIAAVNGDYFMGAGEPQSILFKNGVAIKPLHKLCALCTFLAIDDKGQPSIHSKGSVIDSTKIKEAVGGFHWLVKDSVRITQGDASVEPRTAVGIAANNKVYFVVVDGRQPLYSNGMSFAQLSLVFSALGVKDAINMDGGGSSTLVIKDANGWPIQNKPSGTPRAVANAWTIVDVQ